MTVVISSTFLLARPKVPSCRVLVWERNVLWEGLRCRAVGYGGGETYPLLRKTTGTLVLGVAEEFDDTALVGSEAEEGSGG